MGYVGALTSSSDVHLYSALGRNFAFIADPALVNDMLVDRRGVFEKGVFYDRVRPLAGNGVVLANGAEHRRQRQYLDGFFKLDHVTALAGSMSQIVAEEVQLWSDELDIDAALHRVTFRILAATMFGTNVDQEAFEEIHKALPMVLEAIMFRTVVPGWYLKIPTQRNRRHDKAIQQLRAAITSAMGTAAARRACGGEPAGKDLVSVMNTVRRQDGSALSAEEVADQIVAITMAGAETAATALSWLAVELAADQTLQEQLRQELTCARKLGVPYSPDLAAVPQLKCVLAELLRCRQPILVISRRVRQDTELRGLKFLQGTEVMYSPWAMHREPSLFSAGGRFDEAALSNNGCPMPKGAYTPFGLGPRHCVGEQYAWQMLWIVVAETLTRVNISQAAAQHPAGRPLATIVPGEVQASIEQIAARS